MQLSAVVLCSLLPQLISSLVSNTSKLQNVPEISWFAWLFGLVWVGFAACKSTSPWIVPRWVTHRKHLHNCFAEIYFLSSLSKQRVFYGSFEISSHETIWATNPWFWDSAYSFLPKLVRNLSVESQTLVLRIFSWLLTSKDRQTHEEFMFAERRQWIWVCKTGT